MRCELRRQRALPSGGKPTCATESPIATVSTSLTSFPSIETTRLELSARLVTSARSPRALIDSPEGCLPHLDGGDQRHS